MGHLVANFESGTINHSDTSPGFRFYLKTSLGSNFADIFLKNLSDLGVSRYGVQTTLEEYASFVEENGTPALFVQSGACGGITSREGNTTYCCWPQIFMESGVWAYYVISGGGNQISLMEKAFSKEETIGLAIRKNIVAQNLILGDILAHMK